LRQVHSVVHVGAPTLRLRARNGPSAQIYVCLPPSALKNQTRAYVADPSLHKASRGVEQMGTHVCTTYSTCCTPPLTMNHRRTLPPHRKASTSPSQQGTHFCAPSCASEVVALQPRIVAAIAWCHSTVCIPCVRHTPKPRDSSRKIPSSRSKRRVHGRPSALICHPSSTSCPL